MLSTDERSDEGWAHILDRIEKEKVRFLEFTFVDISGIPKEIVVTIEGSDRDRVRGLLTEGVAFDGSSIEGYATIEESDLKAMPDPATFMVLPSSISELTTATFTCDVFTPAGEPYKGDPRWILKKTIEKYLGSEYVFNAGPELEFFLLRPYEGNTAPRVIFEDYEGYFSSTINSDSANVKKEILSSAAQLGLAMEASHHEVAPSQHEIDPKYGDAVTIADRIVFLRQLTKKIASRHGLYATFMPKPMKGICGNGMHINMSIFDCEGNNAFYDEGNVERFELTEMAYHFAGGLLKHARDMCAILNSTINSYRRLVPGYEAPCYISWGKENRSVLLRVPASKGSSKRLEIRNPDPAGCPYLQFAVLLAAGMEGVKDREAPPAPVSTDVFKLSWQERDERGIPNLPNTLFNALRQMEDSELMKETLGEHLLRNYLHVKRKDWDEFRTEISDWEIRRYLPIL